MSHTVQHFLLQTPSTVEVQQVRLATMLLDGNRTSITNSTLEELENHAPLLDAGAMPVGSVQFVRKAMALAGMQEPPNLSYPQGIDPYLHRSITETPISALQETAFIKPKSTKTFTGFVFQGANIDPEAYSEHDQEQLAVVQSLPAQTIVYASEVVKFLCEWRYYVMKSLIIGCARYDPDGADDAPEPELNVVQRCIEGMAISHPYALDIGVLEDGRTAAVEVNDAWAIGWYRNSIKPAAYLEFLLARWRSLRSREQAQDPA